MPPRPSTAETFAGAFVAPARVLAAAAEARRAWPALAASVLAALLFTAALVPRADLEAGAREALDRAPPEVAQKMTPHEVDTALSQGRKLTAVALYAAALAGPPLLAVAAAALLALAFRVAGARAPFRPTLAVVAWGALPLALRDLLALPAVLTRTGIAPAGARLLLPSSLAALAPDAPARALPLLEALDLFALWSAALVALGMAAVAGTSRTRSAAVVAFLFAASVAVRFALPGLFGGPAAP
ncbi:MAG TPA: YIP1 family protein [Anaeromyxobacteraceae bacterium]|nr:YIP1 family protein [Anaeromyxobacteraceae bacterium]